MDGETVTEIDLQPAKPEEIEGLRPMLREQMASVLAEAWPDRDLDTGFDGFLERMRTSGTTLTVQVSGVTAGFLHYAVRGERLHIGQMSLDTPYQGRGIGRQLIEHCDRQAQRLGLEALELWVQTPNTRAWSIYDHLGFEESGQPRAKTLEMTRPLDLPDDRLHHRRLLHAAARAARAGGRAIREHFHRRQVLDHKSAHDLLTEADLAAEDAIITALQEGYPNFTYHSEEAGRQPGERAETWLIDPLDGTNNFAAGLPHFGPSIALMQGGIPQLGVVYQPVLDDCWAAVRSKGAWCNGRRLHRAAGDKRLHRAVVSWVQGYPVTAARGSAGPGADRADAADRISRRLVERSRRVLRNWAPALDWCLLAGGDIDAVLSYHSERHDLYAGLLIAQEAGVTITDFSGAPWEPGGSDEIAAAAGDDLRRELLEITRSEGVSR